MAKDEADKIAEIRLDRYDQIREFMHRLSPDGTVELQAADSVIVHAGARHQLTIRVALHPSTVADENES